LNLNFGTVVMAVTDQAEEGDVSMCVFYLVFAGETAPFDAPPILPREALNESICTDSHRFAAKAAPTRH